MEQKIYAITITETLTRTIAVKADSLDEALDMIDNAYDNQQIILDADDYNGTDIEKSEYAETDEGTISEETAEYYEKFNFKRSKSMGKIFTKEEAQNLEFADAIHVWMNLDDLCKYKTHWNAFIWNIYKTRLDLHGLSRKNWNLTWNTYGIRWVLSTPNNSYDNQNNITIEDIEHYLGSISYDAIRSRNY